MRTAIWLAATAYWSSVMGDDYDVGVFIGCVVIAAMACAMCEDFKAAFGGGK